MASRRPCSLERADQAKAAFVHKNQACTKFTTLFLSVARCSASNVQSFHHCVATLGVAVVGNSIPFDSEYATHYWDDSAPQIGPISSGLSGRVSNNLRRSPVRMRRVSTRVLGVAFVTHSDDMADRRGDWAAWTVASSGRSSTDRSFAARHQRLWQRSLAVVRLPVSPSPGCGVLVVVCTFQQVSYP